MKGTILDFLQLAAEKPQLAKQLVELAAKHGFEFSDAALSDSDLDTVTGGTGDAQLANVDLQSPVQRQQQLLQTMTSVSKVLSDTSRSIVRKIGS